MLNPNQLEFADFKCNRQLLSTGNLDGDDRVAFFLMDYLDRTRLKILGHARNNPDVTEKLSQFLSFLEFVRIIEIGCVAKFKSTRIDTSQ